MWKVFNYLFGWDYIQWRNSAARGISRVHVGGNDEVFYWRYKSTELADEIKTASQVIWLTCPPNKFQL